VVVALLAVRLAGVVVAEGNVGYSDFGATFAAIVAPGGGPVCAVLHQFQRGMLEQPLDKGTKTRTMAAARKM
jgi:hypothetical protein